MMKYSDFERCSACGAGGAQPKVVDRKILRLTCHRCGHAWARARLDTDGRPNTIELLKAASDKTRARTVERVAMIIEGLKIKDVSPSVFKALANHIRSQAESNSTDMGGDVV